MQASRTPLLLSRPFVVFGLAVAFLLAAGTALLSTISAREVARAGARASETQATVLEINQLLGSLIDAETGQRGYILTGSDTYLEPYTHATARIGDQLAGLRLRMRNAPEQLATLDRIEALVVAKQAELERTITLRRANKSGPALRIVDSGSGLTLMNELRAALRDLETREQAALAAHANAVGQRAAFFQQVGLGVLVAACALGLAGAVVVLRRLNELEDLITVCAWTKRVKFNGTWVSFEEYLRARFNLKFTHGISEDAAKNITPSPSPAPAHPTVPAPTAAPTAPSEPRSNRPRSVQFTPPYPPAGTSSHAPHAA